MSSINVVSSAQRPHRDRGANLKPTIVPTLWVHYDGRNTDPWSPNLTAQEIWLDSSGVIREGDNLGTTFQFLGGDPAPGTVAIYGANVGRSAAVDIRDVANVGLVAKFTPLWVVLNATLANGAVFQTGSTLYDTYRIVFTNAKPGTVVISVS